MTARAYSPSFHLLGLLLGGSIGLSMPAYAGTDVAAVGAWVQAESPASELIFHGSAQGEDFSGKFGHFESRIEFDPELPEMAKFTVRIDLSSADSANAERDELLASADFFAASSNSEALFEIQQASRQVDGSFVAAATLSMKGTRHTVPFSFHFAQGTDTNHAELRGEASINRLDFNVGDGDWADEEMIANRVTIRTVVHLRRE